MTDLILNKVKVPSRDVRHYVENALSDNSRLAYKKDFNHFRVWGGCIPCTPEKLSAYLTDHAGILSIATLQRRLVSIGKAHIMAGYPSPAQSELVKMTMKGIKRVHGCPQRQVSPVMRDDLVAMLHYTADSIKGKRDRALLLLGFCGAFRRSELVALRCTDLDFTAEGLVITLARSKTDQGGMGRNVGIPKGRGKICPVQAVQDWLVHLGANDKHIFRSVTKAGKISDQKLSDRAVADIIKAYAKMSGLDPAKYSGHSLRSGLATSAAEQGFSSWEIRRQTGHASDQTLQRYIRLGSLFQRNAAALF